MTEINCAICKTPFVKKTHNQQFCTKKCFDIHHIQKYGAQKAEASKARYADLKKARDSILYACTFCGAPFSKRRGTKQFCSVKCRANHYYHTMSSERRTKHNTATPAGIKRYKAWRHKTRITSPWAGLLISAKSRARMKKLTFDLTKEWAAQRWTGFCEISKLPFFLEKRGWGPHPYSPSIDRKDREKGYTQENCQFVLWAINTIKHIGTDEEMYILAEAIIKNKKPTT
jgi:hypothetical protein